MRTRQLQCVETPRDPWAVSNTTGTLEQKKITTCFIYRRHAIDFRTAPKISAAHSNENPCTEQPVQSMDSLSQRPNRTDISDTSEINLVASIDFGTTFSGWAYSFKHDFMSDITKIYAKNWNNGTNISTKAPTTVLIEPDGKTFHAFGYEAEDRYAELCAKEEHTAWYYFSRFKMMLHNKLNFEEELLLEDDYGKRLLAKDVFKHAIAFLRGDLKQEYTKRIGEDIDDSLVMWVLTVPAIWNEMAKKFMRDAAVEAGIPDSCLRIALEPEAASLFCKLMSESQEDFGIDNSFFLAREKYMVVDAGGGTVDVSVHQVLHGGTLREQHKASGGAWGGRNVDEAYEHMLMNIFGSEIFKKFRNENMEDYFDLMRTFEVKKQKFTSTSDSDTIIRLPATLVEILSQEKGASLEMAIWQSKMSETISGGKGNKIRVKASSMRDLFSKTVERIIKHISELLEKSVVADVDMILLVGGMSECSLLHEAVQKKFTSLRVIVPSEAGLAVLKGAVMFGYQPAAITERVLQYTYGIAKTVNFQDGVHPLDKLIKMNGEELCKDIFAKLVESEKCIPLDKEILSRDTWTPSTTTHVSIRLFGSVSKCPKFVTDKDCFKVGELMVKFDEDVPSNLEKTFRLYGYFGETEIDIFLQDIQSGKKYFAEFQLPKPNVQSHNGLEIKS